MPQKKVPWIPIALAAAVALVLAWFYFRQSAGAPRPVQVLVRPPEKTRWLGAASIPAFSPDGQRVAFAADVDGEEWLWVAEMESSTVRRLPATEGATYPFWSPDSRSLGFFAGGMLKTIDLTAGSAIELCDAPLGRGGTWNTDGTIVFSPANTGGLNRVPAGGGSPEPVTTLDRELRESSHRTPWFLPDGRHFLYTATGPAGEKSRIYVADLSSNSSSKDRRELMAADSNAVYALPGYLLFVRGRTLLAQAFDAGQLRASGDAFPVAERVDYIPSISQAQFSVSQTGILAYTSGTIAGNLQLTWFDRSGKSTGTLGEPGRLSWPAISPDGNSVVEYREDPETLVYDIWVFDVAGGKHSRITPNSKTSAYPIWSPDGRQVAYSSGGAGTNAVYQKAASEAAPEEVADEGSGRPRLNRRPDDWSRDGQFLIEERWPDPRTASDIWVVPMSGHRAPFPYLHSQFNERHAKLSPDGRWLAYDSDEGERLDVYVTPFPEPGSKRRVSTGGGNRPVWSRDGKELYFIGLDGKMMAAAVKPGAKFEAGAPQPLFESHILGADAWFDVGKDGRFLMPVPVELPAAPITVVADWAAGRKK